MDQIVSYDELWQGYTDQGEPVVEHGLTKQVCREGALHGVAHVWLWRRSSNSVEILLQRRAPGKNTWPDFLDISAAGHIDFGETPLQAAVRETAEELSFALDRDKLRLLFVYRQNFQDESSGIIENEFQWVYGYELASNTDFNLSTREVGATMWLKIRDFKKLATGNMQGERIVPHGDTYFANLLHGIFRKRGL